MNTTTMKELYLKLGKLGPKELILDVRSPEEYQEGHVPGSRNIPHDQVTSHFDELSQYEKIYLHCQAGGRAGRATAALVKMGLKNIVCISSSGMGEWISLGYPIEK